MSEHNEERCLQEAYITS